ncbi:MAG: Gfo/Idh/MocA family oxidoreductase [Bryobacteraceae bacterium]|nr:Gfo/Idh/MocA family oxidoreductase [Bryobacteraceae bacterium]
MSIQRRTLLLGGAAGALAADYKPKRRYRVAVIGHTGRGNYGHSWERAWREIAEAEVVALADPDEKGRAAAVARSGARKAYADYREMIAKEKPDIVTISPRWCDQRVEMVKAAVDAGAHVLMEKPFAKTLEEADAIVAAVEGKGVKLQVGHSARAMAVTEGARELLRKGELGTLLEIRARGKEDRRAGGEDLIVLGTHCFDLMRYYCGDPLWVFSHVTEQGREVTQSMMRHATEPVGMVGGDSIAAMFLFPNGVHGYFGSMASTDRTGRRFGVSLMGSKAFAFVPLNDVPSAEPYLLRSPAWAPEKGEPWERVNYPAGRKPKTRELTNHAMAIDLIEAIETGREPLCGARDGRWTVEMVAGIYQSQLSGGKVAFPLVKRGG